MALRFIAMLAVTGVGAAAFAEDPTVYELAGRITPPMSARVSLFGTSTPFSTSTLMDFSGRFHFKKLRPGLYTLSIFSRGRGEARRTVEIGPALADAKGRIAITLELKDGDFTFASTMNRQLISARQLSVPDSAMRDYQEAQKELSRRNTDAAIERLERAVNRAPQFAAAWNSLGVIAYQTHRWKRAEECFRKAVEADPSLYEALVNLGGVTLTLHKLDEALNYNRKAVSERPNDGLANAQLGITYFSLGQFDTAAQYLERTRQIDPASITFPQLFLYRIHAGRGERGAAADDLENFLAYHPDWAQAAELRQRIAGLRDAAQ